MWLRKELEALAAPFRSTSESGIVTSNPINSPPSSTDTKTVSSSFINISNEKSTKMKQEKKPKKIDDDVVLRRDQNKEKLFLRPGIIDEEPDSMESIISDPASFPITILPSPTAGGCGLLIRNSTAQSSFSRLSRISTSSK